MNQFMNQINDPHEESLVKILGEKIGYGRMMQLAQQEWRKMLSSQQMEGGEFAYGPCVSFTVTCSCRDEGKTCCDWCGGSGWVTRKVRERYKRRRNMPEVKQEKYRKSSVISNISNLSHGCVKIFSITSVNSDEKYI